MLKKILKSVVVTSAVLGAVSFAQDPNLHIYLAYGQSNMSGQATITDTDRQTNPRFPEGGRVLPGGTTDGA